MNGKINIVLVSYNALDYLKITLDSLFKNTNNDYYLTIIDNGSEKEVISYINNLKPDGNCKKIVKIFNKENLGYAKAVNMGLRISIEKRYKFTCFCNNDLYFPYGWLNGLLSEIGKNIVAVYPMGMSSFTTLFGRPTRDIFEDNMVKGIKSEIDFLEKNQGLNIKKICAENQSRIFDHFPQFLPDHCVLVDTDFIEKIGFFADERYALYGSNDVDICWEIFERDGKIMETNKSFVYHFRHKSLEDNNMDRKALLIDTSKVLFNKWKNKIEEEIKSEGFFERFFDINNRDYNILRLMNEKIHYIKQDTRILAVFGGIGKTFFAQKYPKLCSDIEVTNFRYDYGAQDIDYEKVKGLKKRRKNPEYPSNYIIEVGKYFNKKALMTVVLSEEILHKLDRMGIVYDIVYPRKRMKKEILERMRLRGNSEEFLKKIENIIDEYEELKSLKRNLRSKNIYYADGDDTLEDIIVREGILDDLVLNHSFFEYKGIKYNVRFNPHKTESHEECSDFTQVYCVGKMQDKILVIYHRDKSGKKIFNLPGGTREPGENLEQNLRREILEETNCRVIDYKILGSQINTSEFGEVQKPQVRVFANLVPYGKFEHDPGGGVEGYELIDIAELEKYIKWGEVGEWIMLKVGNLMRSHYE